MSDVYILTLLCHICNAVIAEAGDPVTKPPPTCLYCVGDKGPDYKPRFACEDYAAIARGMKEIANGS